MGFFNLFGNGNKENSAKESKTLPWKKLTRLEQLGDVKEASKTRPVVIFKHSTTCGISRMVLRTFERDYAVEDGKIDLYYLDLLAFRDVSNEVAIQFQVVHQSPQLLIIQNESTVHHASHQGIQASDIEKFV